MPRGNNVSERLAEGIAADRMDGGDRRAGGGECPDRSVDIGPFVDHLDRAAIGEFESCGGQHRLGDGGRVAETRRRCLVAGGGVLDDGPEVGQQAHALVGAPVGQSETTGFREDTPGLDQCAVAPVPNAVEAGDHVERSIGEWEIEHVADAEIGLRRARHGNVDQRRRGIQPAHGRSTSGGGIRRQTGAAGHVEQARASADTEAIEQQVVRRPRIWLEQVGPVRRLRAPTAPGLPPIAAVWCLIGGHSGHGVS